LLLLFPAPNRLTGAIIGWLYGCLWFALVVSPWLWPTLRSLFDHSPFVDALLLVFVWQWVAGVPSAGLGLLLHRGARLSPAARPFFAAASWVVIELVRTNLPFGTPWALLGTGLAETPLAVQVADIGGVYAVSFLAVLASALLVEIVRRPARPTWGWVASLFLPSAVLLGGLGYGALRLTEVRAQIAAAPTAQLALVHADLPGAWQQDLGQALASLRAYLALSPALPDLDLIVWPENAVPVLLEENPALIDRAREVARSAPLLLGAPRISDEAGISNLRAAAFLVGPDGIVAAYEKRRLLPLAETSGTFGADNLWMAVMSTDSTSNLVLRAGRLRLAPLICYEAIYADLARAAVRAGANLLVNLSNDTWLARTSGRDQHFLFMRLRAVELRRTLVRAANRGVTGVVSADGTVRVSARGNRPGAEIVTVPLLDRPTIYELYGDLFAGICALAVLVILLATGFAKSRSRQADRPADRGTPGHERRSVPGDPPPLRRHRQARRDRADL
jgi:apolipoprotein N-acyltransferase